MTTTVRLPLRIEQALATYCVETKRTKSEVIVELLEQRLMGTQTESTPYELAREAGFIGCIAGKAQTASTKERVVAAIRKKHGKTPAR
jgi:predicted DNA-binding protein